MLPFYSSNSFDFRIRAGFLGFTMGWILVGPLYGPAFSGLVTNPAPYLAFTVVHAAGLLATARLRQLSAFPVLSGLTITGLTVCTVLTLLAPIVPQMLLPLLFSFLGFFSAPAIILWFAEGRKTTAKSTSRATLVAIVIVIANSLLFGVNFVMYRFGFGPHSLALFTAGMPLVSLATLGRLRRACSGTSPDDLGDLVSEDWDHVGISPRNQKDGEGIPAPGYKRLAIFVFFVYLLAGFYYSWSVRLLNSPVGAYYSVFPYMACAAFAAYLHDRRKHLLYLAILGVLSMAGGLGFTVLTPTPVDPWLFQTAFNGGFGFLDVFLWTSLIRISNSPHGLPKVATCLAANLAAITAGAGLIFVLEDNSFRATMTSAEQTNMALLGSTLLTVSMTLLLLRRTQEGRHPAGWAGVPDLSGDLAAPARREILVTPGSPHASARSAGATLTGTSVPQGPPAVPSSPLEKRIKARLSERERDVLTLILRGIPTREVAKELYVSQNTVRTHLRNIYRKLEVPNRQVLLARYFSANEQHGETVKMD